MGAGLQHHLRGAVGGLRGQQCGGIARQAHVHSGLGQRLDDDVQKRRAGSGQARHRVHVLFIDNGRPAYGGEDTLRERQLLVAGMLSAAQRCDALAQHGRGVGHGPDDRDGLARGLFDRAGPDRSSEGDQQLGARRLVVRGSRGTGSRGRRHSQSRRNLTHHSFHLLWLDAQQDHVGILRRLQVVGGYRDVQPCTEQMGPLLVRNCGGDLLACEQAAAQKGLQQDAAHLPGSQHSNAKTAHGDAGLLRLCGFGAVTGLSPVVFGSTVCDRARGVHPARLSNALRSRSHPDRVGPETLHTNPFGRAASTPFLQRTLCQ